MSDASEALKPIHVRFDSDPEHLQGLRLRCEAMATAMGFDERAVGEVGLCVNEAIANVIEHAYKFEKGRPIELRAEPIPPAAGRPRGGMRLRVRDWGPGIDPTLVDRGPKDPNIPKGLGLICMKEMMDSTDYAPQPDGGIILTLEKYLPAT